jgi:MerR family copper efflux transcriptional regulator
MLHRDRPHPSAFAAEQSDAASSINGWQSAGAVSPLFAESRQAWTSRLASPQVSCPSAGAESEEAKSEEAKSAAQDVLSRRAKRMATRDICRSPPQGVCHTKLRIEPNTIKLLRDARRNWPQAYPATSGRPAQGHPPRHIENIAVLVDFYLANRSKRPHNETHITKELKNMSELAAKPKKRLQVGAFAKRVGKTVRAMHLYEELGLLKPVDRSKGGFRLYDETSIERASWIVKLQGIGFTLAQIQGFVADFERAATGPVATSQARVVFTQKLSEVQTQLTKLQRSEEDLVEALNYLDGGRDYASELSPANCEQGHTPDEVPHLFVGLDERAVQRDTREALNRTPSSFRLADEQATSSH